ncbi:MAG: pentapeptide repeat-containing protein [Desulfuromonadaceae bacterium]
MKAVVVNPPWLYKLPKADRMSNLLGPLYVAAAANKRGHEVFVLDALREAPLQVAKVDYSGYPFFRVGLSYEQILQRIPVDTDCIAISAPFTNLFHLVCELCAVIKSERPGTLVVLGGGLPSAATKLCSHMPHVDVIITGEGEQAFADCLDDLPKLLNRGEPLIIRSLGQTNLDELPVPDRFLTNTEQYFSQGARLRTSLSSASMITSRGCPYSCHFCSIKPTMGEKWRARSRGAVLEEIRSLVCEHQVQIIEFEDDNFLHDYDRAVGILEDLAAFRRVHPKLLAFSLPNGVRIDKLTPDIITLMRDSGLYKLVLPIEHGDLSIRRKMGKPLTDEEIYNACCWASEAGIRVEAFVMIGYPDETVELFEASLQLLGRVGSLPNTEINYLFPQPYPGTRLREECLQHGYRIDVPDETLFCGIGPVITTPLFDLQELDRRRREMDVLIQHSKAVSSRTERVPRPMAVRSTVSAEAGIDGVRVVYGHGELGQRRAGIYNGSYLFDCRIPADHLQGATMMMSEFERCDFSGADLSDFIVSWSVFNCCDFQGALLDGACLGHCGLRGVNFSNLSLSRTILARSDLTRADLSQCLISDATLEDSVLCGADFIRAQLSGCTLSRAIFVGTRMDFACFDRVVARDALFQEVSFRSFFGTNLSLQRSVFKDCDFSDSRLSGDFSGSVFERCRFDRSVFENCPESGETYREVWDGSGRHMVADHKMLTK